MFKNIKLMGSFLMVIFIGLLVAAAGDFSITHITTTSFTVNPGEAISGNFSMTNSNSADALTVDFPNTVDLIGTNYNYTGISMGYNVSDSFNLASGATEYVSYDITMPSDIYADSNSYAANVNVTAGAGNWSEFVLDITAQANSSLSTTDITTTIVSGYNSIEPITVTNDGNSDVTGITYSKSDLVKGGDIIPLANIVLQEVSSVNYRSSGVVNATITVPSNQATGVYNGNITVNYDGKTVLSYLTVTVEPIIENLIAIDGSATWVKGISSSETAVMRINNTGNVNISVTSIAVGTLSYNSVNLSSGITPDKTSFELAPTETEDITFTINNIPENQTSGGYTGDITIDWGTGNQTNSTLTVTVTSPSYSIMTIPDPITFEEVDQNSNVSTSFNITNNGNAPMQNVNLASSMASKYNVQISPTSLGTLSVDESVLVNVDVTIPEDEATDEHSLGSISVTSDEYNTSFNLHADVRGKLEISDIDTWVDGDSDKNVQEGATIDKDAKPLSTVKFDIRLDNRFSDNDDEDIEIENVEVTIIIEEIDDGDDLEETLEDFDLKADKYKRVEHEFEIPLDVEESTYNVIITAEGEDENGVMHTDKVELKLEVDKESHKVIIDKTRLFPEEVSCGGGYSTLEVSITNIGTHNEDEVVIGITSSDLDININEQVELDKDPDDDENNFRKSYTIDIPEEISAGRYPIDIRVYYDMDEISDHIREFITIKECSSDNGGDSTTSTTDDSVTLITDSGNDDLIPPVIQPDVQSWIKEQGITQITTFTKSNAYLALLVLANIALVGAVGIMAAKFLFLRP